MKIKHLGTLVLAFLAAGGPAATAQTNTNALATNAPAASTNVAVASTHGIVTPTNAPDITTDDTDITPTNAIKMDFHDVPLNTVLKYLSKKMGFVINSDVELRGTATIVSEQPIGTNEVLRLLSSALAKNNYAVQSDGRILNITTADTAKTGSGTPVLQATTPATIPINDEIATYVLPVHTLNPTQLVKDLAELVPPGATVTANEAGNAILMTARQKDIHRFAEIIAALDGSSVSEVQVRILRFADAKSVADELKEIFQSPDSTVARADRPRFRGFGFGGGFPGGGDDRGSGTESKNAANKAVFTSDDQMNAVIASAPPDYFPMITNVLDELDKPSEDITVMKVFHLKYADPQETADELSSMFSDDTKTDQNSRSMGVRFMPPWMQPQTPANNKSERMTRQTTVRAVPDLRTEAVIVTASKDMMEQIAGIIEDLDSSPAQKKFTYSIDIDHADPATVQAAMTALFAGPNTKNQSATQNQSVLQERQQATAQQQSQATSTTTSGGATQGLR